ncbi:hypothetical protein ACFYE2_14910 [Kocuria sp. CPCC 205300]|uniref:hypothetical protein n=1 Tax=Kocuria sabuli TaxID=3071448 RepID=UPI0036DF1980
MTDTSTGSGSTPRQNTFKMLPSVLMAQETETLIANFQSKALLLDIDKKAIRAACEKLRESTTNWIGEYVRNSMCRWPECAELAIEKSHTLQRNGALKAVSESHVRNVGWASRVGPIHLGIGRIKASVFPGFCETHEKHFGVFEKQKKLNRASHYELQLYRTAAKEHWRHLAAFEYFGALPELVHNLRSDFDWIDSRFNDFMDSSQERLIERRNTQGITKGHLSGIEKELAFACTGINTAHFDKDLLSHTQILKAEVEKDLLYAYSGALHFRDDRYSFVLLLVVIPQDGRTLVLMASEEPFGRYLERFKNIYLRDGDAFIRVIESWVGYRPDDWYFSWDWWNKSAKRRKKVLSNVQENIPKMRLIRLGDMIQDI